MSDVLPAGKSTDPTDVAVAWVEALLSRGVSIQLRGTSLAYRPKSGYSQMTNEERATLKRHKLEICTVLRDRYNGEAVAREESPPPAPKVFPTAISEPEPEPEPCPYCRQSPSRCAELKATNYEAWECLHHDDPEVVRKRDEIATKVMMQQIGKPLPDWYR